MNLFEKHKKSGWNPFDTYKVQIHLHDIVGGIPRNPELIEAWIKAGSKKMSQEERERIRDTHVDKLGEVADEKREKQGIGFHRMDDGQLCIEGRQVKAMLKEAANIIKDTVPTGRKDKDKPVVGIAQLKSKTADQVFITEEFIPLGRTEPDAVEEKPIHVDTAMGPRDSIKVYEICRDVNVEFVVRRHKGMGKKAVPEAALLAILDYGQNVGLGADRSQGRGTFEVVNVEKIK